MATYYVKSGGGTGSGLDDANAWSVAKFLSTNVSGHTVLFKRGDTFNTTLQAEQSNFTIGSYGTGENPIISGFTTLSSWTLYTGNIYYATIDVPYINMVTVDGAVKAMGRYPVSGYLQYTSHTGSTAIIGADVATIPFNSTGGEVVMRKYRYIMDKVPISAHSGTTITFSAGTDIERYGQNGNTDPTDFNGFFIQSHLSTLVSEGNWYYDGAANRFYMHFGAGTPSGKTIKVSALDRNMNVNSQSNVVINDLIFEGANNNGLYLVGASNILVNNCLFRNQGCNGVYGIEVTDVAIDGVEITDALNNGIFIEYLGERVTANNITTANIGIIPGAGKSGDGSQIAILITGSNSEVTNCTVIDTGYNGIDVAGNNPLVENNTVTNFCLIKDDGGGIYHFIGQNALIKGNTVNNAVGAYAGAEWGSYEPFGKAAGIYLDNGTNTHNAVVEDNIITDGDWAGIFINDNGSNTIRNNNISGFRYQLYIIEYSAGTVRNMNVVDNELYADVDQDAFRLHIYNNDNLALLGQFNNNHYSKIGSSKPIYIRREYSGGSNSIVSLETWKSLSAQDATSIDNGRIVQSSGVALISSQKLLKSYSNP